VWDGFAPSSRRKNSAGRNKYLMGDVSTPTAAALKEEIYTYILLSVTVVCIEVLLSGVILK